MSHHDPAPAVDRAPSHEGALLLSDTQSPPRTVSGELARALQHLGATHAFGVSGGAIARFGEALDHSDLALVHARHETGAALMACEASLATDAPMVVFTTTGPGLTNAYTGLAAAACEGAKVLCVVPTTPPGLRGRGAFQETRPGEDADGRSGGVPRLLHELVVDSPAQLSAALRRLRDGWAGPTGYVAILRLAIDAQAAPTLARPSTSTPRRAPPRVPDALIEACASAVSRGRTALLVGWGARHHASLVRELAEGQGLPVLCSPRAKGIFPEDHPQFVGVTGLFGGHAAVRRFAQANRVDQLVVLGSRLGEATSAFSPALRPRERIVHVDLDATAFGAAYPDVETLGGRADIGDLVRRVLARCPTTRAPWSTPVPADVWARGGRSGPVHPGDVMASVQRVVIDGSDAVVFSDAGNSFAWANHALRFREPGRYRVAPAFAAMTHAVNGAVGAALATGRSSLAIVGDGAMLMNNEVSTAVAHRAPVVWVVLNDAAYGMVRHGMVAIGMRPWATDIPRVDLAAYGRAMGARGVVVRRAGALDAALDDALRSRAPTVVDVRVDAAVAPPFGARNERLEADWS